MLLLYFRHQYTGLFFNSFVSTLSCLTVLWRLWTVLELNFKLNTELRVLDWGLIPNSSESIWSWNVFLYPTNLTWKYGNMRTWLAFVYHPRDVNDNVPRTVKYVIELTKLSAFYNMSNSRENMIFKCPVVREFSILFL